MPPAAVGPSPLAPTFRLGSLLDRQYGEGEDKLCCASEWTSLLV